MGEIRDSFKYSILGAVLLVIVFAIIAVGSMAINGTLYPWWLSIQRKAVEQSKSFTDSNNNMLETYKLEYAKLDTKIAESQGNEDLIKAYKAQQVAVTDRMCRQISTMKKETVNPDTLSWLNSKGGCR
jgi:hypothetical protein